VIAGAVAVAALAPTIQTVLNPAVFERFAAIIILAIAGRTASAKIGEWLPRPSMILLIGLVASVQTSGFDLIVQTDPELMLRSAAAAGVGVALALTAAVTAPWLRNAVDIDRFRFGSAVALGVLPISILTDIEAPIALAVLGVTTLLSLDPQRARERDEHYEPDAVDMTAAFADGGASQGVDHDDADATNQGPIDDDGEDRAPWL